MLLQAIQRSLKKGIPMKTIQKFAVSAVTASFLLGLGGCSGMTARDQNTAVGAGVGAVGGALLTGSPVGVIGGAVVGGVIGHEVGR
jgi:osmotically inducible lipoprotein OsmB